MEVNRCARCGGFHMMSDTICAKCYDKEMEEVKLIEEQFKGLEKVDYSNIADASKVTNISAERIERYLDTYLKM